MRCPICGSEIEEVEIETPIGRRRGLRVTQWVGRPLCSKCQERIAKT